MDNETFDDIEKCKKNIRYVKQEIKSVYPIITNEKDLQNIEINEFDNNEIKINKNKLDYNVIYDKFNSEVYRFFNKNSIETTLNYLFYELNNGIYVEIKNNKVSKFLPFNNMRFKNNWGDIIKLDSKYNSTKDYFNVKNKLFPYRQSEKYSVYNKTEWSATDCLIFTEKGKGKPYINDSYWVQLKNLLKETCKNRDIPDIVFFINKKDLPYLKKNRTHPYESIVGKNHRIDIGKYYYFSPILSQSTRDDYADIPIPSSDEWEFITQQYFINGCSNNYIKTNEPKWDDKINTAFFRGGATGCGIDVYTNPRLNITKINNDWKNNSEYNENNKIDKIPFLDAGVIKFSNRNRAVNGTLKFQNVRELKNKGVVPVNYVDHEKQSKYKYIIYIEGNSAAYRLSYMLSKNSVILKVESKYKLWFEHLLIAYEHYVPIKEDLSDLADVIKWCKLNDKKCKKIASNANAFCKKHFNRDYIYDYMQNIFINISNRQISNKQINIDFYKYKKERKIMDKKYISVDWKDTDPKIKTAIIVPYRDNKLQDRKKQLDIFIDFWESKKDLLKKYTFKIFISEQSNDNRKFNRGQLLNLGFLAAEKEGFNNFIFHDVDLLPSDDLLPYYFYNTELPLHIGNLGKKYSFFTFFGGITGFPLKLLHKINGFPNQLWGWGGEDDIIYNRCAILANVKNILIPNKGAIKELYHVDSTSIKSLNMNDNIKRKLVMDDLNNTFNDGISNLKISDILKSKTLQSKLFEKYIFGLKLNYLQSQKIDK